MHNWKTPLDRHLKCAFKITHRYVIWHTHGPKYRLSNFNSKCAFRIKIQNTHFAIVWKQSKLCCFIKIPLENLVLCQWMPTLYLHFTLCLSPFLCASLSQWRWLFHCTILQLSPRGQHLFNCLYSKFQLLLQLLGNFTDTAVLLSSPWYHVQ